MLDIAADYFWVTVALTLTEHISILYDLELLNLVC